MPDTELLDLTTWLPAHFAALWHDADARRRHRVPSGR